MGDSKPDRLSTAEAEDVIVGLQRGDSFDEEYLRRFANYADDIAEKLAWISANCVCAKCRGPINAEMFCARCVMGESEAA